MPAKKKHSSTRARANKASTAATLRPAEAEDRTGWTAAQLRGEIDARNENRDAGDRLSKAGGKAGMMATLSDDDFGIPPLPERPYGWHEMTEQWWYDVWSSPMSAEWHPESDWHNVVAAAMHYDDMWKASTPIDRQKADAAFVKRCEPLGLNPYARRRLEWSFEVADEAKARGSKRRGQSQAPGAAPAPQAGQVDPRAALHMVK